MVGTRSMTKLKAATMATAAAGVMLTSGSGTAIANTGDLTIFNPGQTAIVYDNVGHILGGGERRTVPPLDSMGCYVLGWGWIIVKKGTPVCPPAPSSAESSADPVESQHVVTEQEESGESVPA